ncbi:MAG: GYD domain-containing protein [Devosia sp.]|uniref:GYD domain-containing protein n=1 Tax=Devosia sp. TaxID=1871048 RepID=UPI0037C0182F
MPKYIALIHRTDQGRKTLKDGPARLDASKSLAAKFNCTLTDFYYTVGQYDQIAIIEAPDELSAAKCKSAVEAIGAIHMSQMRLFDVDEYRAIAAAI